MISMTNTIAFSTGQKVNRASALNYQFTFNMFSIRGKKEKITDAELRLFKRRHRSKSGPWWCSIALFLRQTKGKTKRNRKTKKRNKFNVKGNTSESSQEVFVGVKVIPLLGKSRWLTFNVSKAVRDQFEKHRNKLVRFKVYIVTYGGTIPRKSWISRKGQNRPNLVVYSKLKNREPRGTLSLDLNALTDTLSLKSRAKRGNKNQYCKRRSLYVKFQSLNLDWIVAPVGFSAFVCDGTCPELLTSYFNPNNHAILQNLLHFRVSKEIPQASCVPTSLSALTILYADVGNSFALREFPDMVASSCGCR